MNQRLKQLTIEMNFGCEAEVFASDLRFKMYDDDSCSIYKSKMPDKNEDAMQNLKARLNKIIEISQNPKTPCADLYLLKIDISLL